MKLNPWQIHPEYGMDWGELEKLKISKLREPDSLKKFLHDIDYYDLVENRANREDAVAQKAMKGIPPFEKKVEGLSLKDVKPRGGVALSPWAVGLLMALTPSTAEAPEVKK